MIEEKPPVTTVTRKTVGDPEEQPYTIGHIGIIAIIVVISAPTLLIVGHALPLLDNFFNGMKPLVGILGYVVGLSLFALIALGLWYVHDRFRVDIKRRIIEARKFTVDPQSGNYDAYFDTNKTFAIPKPGVTVPVVPQTYAPRIHIANSYGDDIHHDPSDRQQTHQAQGKPQIAELVEQIEKNSLTLCLGRSLTKASDYLIAELAETHIKIIGGTRMGKSCEAGAILDQVQLTHDPSRLCFSLLDLEYKTSRLFERSAHLAILSGGRGREVVSHAKSIEEVPLHLHYLAQELERRDRLASYQEVEKLPHILVYLEEFLNLKRQLRSKDKKTCEQFLIDFNTLTTRGLKLGLHVMACAQVDYADDDLKEAMNQFVGLNIAFGVRPQAAAAAGFVNYDLLNQNYASRTPGQFVLEMLGGADLGVAPEYDVKAKLKALHETRVLSVARETIVLDAETLSKHSRNEERNVLDSALQAKLHRVMEVPGEPMRDCIKRCWGATPGDNEAWRSAKAEYEKILKIIHQLAIRGMEAEH